MVYCIVTLHLWVRILKSFSELRVLTYPDDETTIGRLSQVLTLGSLINPVFELDVNLDFNMVKTQSLAKDLRLVMFMNGTNTFFRMILTFRSL
jgi:hypothetical protein